MKERILIVDDNFDIAEATAGYIRSHLEISSSIVLSPQLALEWTLRGRHFDVIVSDYDMPEMNGMDFYHALRRSGSRASFIVFTSDPVVIEAHHEDAPGFVAVIDKSKPRQLVDTILEVFVG